MITANKGKSIIKGERSEILAELAGIVNHIFETLSKDEEPEEAKKAIYQAVDLAFMSDEEISKELKKKFKEVMKTMFEDLDDILEDLED